MLIMRFFERIFTVLLVAVAVEAAAKAQEPAGPECIAVTADTVFLDDSMLYVRGGEVPQGYELADSLFFIPAERMDTALAGKDIFNLLSSISEGGAADVNIYQSQGIVDAMEKSFADNSFRLSTGYRVRIFFDNRQSARQDSEDMMAEFEKMYPGVPAYRSYVNPYFKITVGDFRTRSEAMHFLKQIIGTFPKAFIVKENIEYPVLDKDSLGRVDTVQILRKVAEPAVLQTTVL